MQAETESVSLPHSSLFGGLPSPSVQAVTGLISELRPGISLFIFMISGTSLFLRSGIAPFHSNVFPIISAPAKVSKRGQAGVIQYPPSERSLRHRIFQVIFMEDRMDTPWKELMIPLRALITISRWRRPEQIGWQSVNKITELNLDEVKGRVLTKHGVHSTSLRR